jgi:uncharacterized OB-fold protein
LVHVRVCRDCGEEYRPEVAVCADCGGALEDRYDEQEGWVRASRRAQSGPEEAPPEPPPDYVPVYVDTRPTIVMQCVRQLEEAGVRLSLRARPASDGSAPVLEIYVPEAEQARARRVLVPLIDEMEPTVLEKVDREFDPQTGYRRCPACDADLTKGVVECPSCGLAAGSVPTCPECGEALPEEAARCPRCGTAFDQD